MELVTVRMEVIQKHDNKQIGIGRMFRFYVKVSEHTMLHRKHCVKFLDHSLIVVT